MVLLPVPWSSDHPSSMIPKLPFIYFFLSSVNIYDFAANMSQDVPHLKVEMEVKCDNVIVLPNRDKKTVAKVDKDLNKVVEEGGKEALPEPSQRRKKRQADNYNPAQKQPQVEIKYPSGQHDLIKMEPLPLILCV